MKRRTIRKVITDPLEHNKKQINFPRVTVRQNNVNKVLSGAHRKPRSFTRAKHTEDAKPIKFATEITQANKEVCFIVGGGPSLTGFDFNQISDFDTIAVNKAVEYLHNPTYFITTDYTYFLKASLPIEKINLKTKHSYFIANMMPNYMSFNDGYIVDTRDNRQYQDLYKYGSVIKSSNKVGFGLTLKDFHNGGNSGHCAIQLALLKGYKKIYLLGFDLTLNNQTHFHQSYSQVHQDSFRTKTGEYAKTLLSSLAKYNKSQKIINLSSSSILATSPHIKTQSFAEVISNLNASKIKPTINNNDKLMVVGYYTVNTPYEDEAKNLLRSLNKLNINHDISGVKTLGNWQANTRFKAKFMLDMLIKWPKHNLLYVDVDAVIHGPLNLFKNYNCDIAVRWQDFRWRKNECLSGTIYMENNHRTKRLCELWRDINVKEGNQTNRMEQWNLDTVINKMKADPTFTYKNLPPEYTFIFDIMKGIYPNAKPVIEHYQASRRFKNDVNNIS